MYMFCTSPFCIEAEWLSFVYVVYVFTCLHLVYKFQRSCDFLSSLCLLQCGCCKPSNDCNFTYQSPTFWKKTEGVVYSNPDCNAWDNNPNVLCFNCQSCKAGLLQNLKTDWKKVAVVNIIFLIILIIVYSIGCCAFRNSRRDNWK